jgi:UDP-N-acetylglucosamine--N-acetylmuramyl-(pentapeptide) pyrophosphoryl-undecaprenol N-acetylglucosamine transferase
VFSLVKDYSVIDDSVYHFHATGKGGFDEQAALYENEGFTKTDDETVEKNNVYIKKYIYNMPELLAAADVVICRAGAMTLTEIAALGKAAVIIPSPNVTDNHQYKNAKVLADGDAATLIEEKDLSGELLVQKVKMYASDEALRKQTEQNVKKFAVYDTLDRIFDIVCGLTK